jgi:hypothetical protein
MQLEGKIVCVEVEVVDAPLDYHLVLGQSWTYAMHVLVAIFFWVLCLSFSRPDPSSGASMVLMIDNS